MRYDAAMRALAHQTVDALFDHVEDIAGRRVVDWQTSDELRARVRIDDRGGADGMALMRQLMENAIQLHHPAYMGHQVCPPFPTAVIADLVISTLEPVDGGVGDEPDRDGDRAGGRPLAGRSRRLSRQRRSARPSPAARRRISPALLAARARWNDSGACGQASGRSSARADAHYSIARAAAIMGIPTDVVKVADRRSSTAWTWTRSKSALRAMTRA